MPKPTSTKSIHRRMSIDEFHQMEHLLGWKYEYWDGQAHIRPAHTLVCCRLDTSFRLVSAHLSVRFPHPDDQDVLMDSFVRAFAPTTEFCDYSHSAIVDAAAREIRSLFDPITTLHPASRIAVYPDESKTRIAGAALVEATPNRPPQLRLLWVEPDWQGKGVATALVGSVANALVQANEPELYSIFHLANVPSRCFHLNFGFVPLPDLLLARHLAAYVRYALYRHETSNDLSPEAFAALRAQSYKWQYYVDSLEEQADREGFDSVCPLRTYY